MQKEVVYFAYGSNMNPDQMAERCPGAKAVCPAKLRNYRLAERKYADIDPEEGSNVYGVMYTVPEDEMKRLDGFEGAPRFYKRVKVQVEFAMKPYKAVTYILTPEMKKERNGIPFPEDYRARCSAGAEHYNIPNDFEYVTLITYGTLMSGEYNHHLVKSALCIKPCLIKGTLYDTGFGFPAYTPEGESSIMAELIRIPRNDWLRVDDLEGYPHFYDRKFIVASLDSGTAGGYVYIMNSIPTQAKVIKKDEPAVPVVSWRSGKLLKFDNAVCWHSDENEEFELTVDLAGCRLSGRIGDLDVPESCTLSGAEEIYRNLLRDAHFELWQTEYYSNGDETRAWSVELYDGDELVKTIHGTDIYPMHPMQDFLTVLRNVSKKLLDEQ